VFGGLVLVKGAERTGLFAPVTAGIESIDRAGGAGLLVAVFAMASATKLSAQLTIVDDRESDVAQSERTLAAGRRAITSSRATERLLAHRTVRSNDRAVTRSVTPGL
jgi:hypothetical protein